MRSTANDVLMGRRMLLLAGIVLAVATTLGFVGLQDSVEILAEAVIDAPFKPKPRKRKGGADVSFIVTSDTHFGYANIAESHQTAIGAMNSIAGKKFPANVPGSAGIPLGVLISGDLTEDGRPEEWAQFLEYYDDKLDYPLFETWGNHDKHHGWYVKEQIEKRHGSVRYSWDWQDLHVVSLGEAPDHEDLVWLAADLRAVDKEVGVILYFHFPLRGPFSRRHWFGEGDYKRALETTLSGYNVLGIFHGHYHACGMYEWQGHDIYNVGTPKHHFPSFAVVRITDERMIVASWNYERNRWWWWHDKPINGSDGPTRRHIEPGLVGSGR
jgi:hypothetical protein